MLKYMVSEWFTIKSVYDRNTKEQIKLGNIKRNNNYMCEYECNNCNRLNIVTLNVFIDKQHKGIQKCSTCNTSKFNLYERLLQDENDFEKQDDDFKDNYFCKHLTREEFERIRPNIKSFQHEKFADLSKFEYFPCVKIGNQSRFHPYMYDVNRDVIEKFIYIRYTCDCCGDIFFNRDLCVQKNKYKVLCSSCGFTNNTFKIRNMKNCRDETIRYQSQFEKKFVNFCNDNKILVRNGPTISYEFNGAKKYKVDFQLPDFKLLIEIKDNHKQNIESGKWQAKQCAVETHARKHEQEFMLIFPKTYARSKDIILKKTNKI